jgi:exodeoxyribonuclease V alpha subunit
VRVDFENLRMAGWLSPVDCHFATSIGRLADEDEGIVLLAAAFASRQVATGQVCLDLSAPPAAPASELELDHENAAIEWPEPGAWQAALASSRLVESVGPGVSSIRASSDTAPLVLDAGGRLYLRRYWEHQQRLADALRARASSLIRPDELDEAELERGLARLFPPDAKAEAGANLQRAAAECALRHRLCVISGGPGTGKTSTVARILVLLAEQARVLGLPTPRMTLAAPTGKAAANLADSIRANLAQIETDAEIKQAIPLHAATIHRVLGSMGRGGRRFRHDESDLVATDLLLVDEASMVDLALMDRLCAAVPPSARLILLGDRDQLASVEAGAVLGDICNAGVIEDADTGGSEVVESAGPMAGRVVQLRHSYRYGAGSGIGALARAINEGDADKALDLLANEDYGDVHLEAAPAEGRIVGALANDVRRGYAPYLEAESAEEKLARMGRYRVLAAHRRGPGGVEDLNGQIERILALTGKLRPEAGFYDGRPVMMMRNDYDLELYNGDVGLIARMPDAGDSGLRALFPGKGVPGKDAEARWIPPLRLRYVDTVFAMSVHKSQGSEFDAVAIVLPDRISPVVTRELVYTAVSRARGRVTIYASAEILRAALACRVERASGLREALWALDPEPSPPR